MILNKVFKINPQVSRAMSCILRKNSTGKLSYMEALSIEFALNFKYPGTEVCLGLKRNFESNTLEKSYFYKYGNHIIDVELNDSLSLPTDYYIAASANSFDAKILYDKSDYSQENNPEWEKSFDILLKELEAEGIVVY